MQPSSGPFEHAWSLKLPHCRASGACNPTGAMAESCLKSGHQKFNFTQAITWVCSRPSPASQLVGGSKLVMSGESKEEVCGHVPRVVGPWPQEEYLQSQRFGPQLWEIYFRRCHWDIGLFCHSWIFVLPYSTWFWIVFLMDAKIVYSCTAKGRNGKETEATQYPTSPRKGPRCSHRFYTLDSWNIRSQDRRSCNSPLQPEALVKLH